MLFLILAILLVLMLMGSLFVLGKLNRIDRIDKANEIRIDRALEDFETDAGDAVDIIRPEDIVWDKDEIEPVFSETGIKNILLIGQDARPGEGRQRSDSMIICSLNYDTNTITMVSIMRDLYVPIPGYSDNRINATYAFGGMSLLDQVIEEDFGIHIDANVEVNFEGFLAAMTEVGEIQIDLNADEVAYLKRINGSWNLVAGTNYLNPEQALAYARARHVGNADYERTERQRIVLRACFAKLRQQNITTLLSMADRLFPNLTTDMTNTQILGYIYNVITSGMNLASEDYRIPVDGTFTPENVRGMSVLVPDLKKNADYLREYIYGE